MNIFQGVVNVSTGVKFKKLQSINTGEKNG